MAKGTSNGDLVKAISKIGEKLDLISKAPDNNGLLPIDTRAEKIINLVAQEVDIPAHLIKAGFGPEARFALNSCYCLFGIHLKWTQRTIAKYMGKKNHNSVRYGALQIKSLDKENRIDGPVYLRYNKIEKIIKTELSKKVSHGKR